MSVAGQSKPLKAGSKTVGDELTRRAILALEDKVNELDTRLKDAERRLKAGNL